MKDNHSAAVDIWIPIFESHSLPLIFTGFKGGLISKGIFIYFQKYGPKSLSSFFTLGKVEKLSDLALFLRVGPK